MQYVGQTTRQKPARNNLKKGKKSSEPSAIHTPALAPTNLPTFLYKLHLRKSDRVIIKVITLKEPSTPPLLCRAKTANARTYKHTTAARFMEVNDGLCTQSWSSILRYLLDVVLSNRVSGRKKKHGTKAFTATIMDKR